MKLRTGNGFFPWAQKFHMPRLYLLQGKGVSRSIMQVLRAWPTKAGLTTRYSPMHGSRWNGPRDGGGEIGLDPVLTGEFVTRVSLHSCAGLPRARRVGWPFIEETHNGLVGGFSLAERAPRRLDPTTRLGGVAFRLGPSPDRGRYRTTCWFMVTFWGKYPTGVGF